MLGTLSAIVFAVIAFSRNRKHDTREDSTQIAVMSSDIGYIKSSTDDIKKAQESLTDEVTDLKIRYNSLASEVNALHTRLDSMNVGSAVSFKGQCNN